jgi:hypothetical protein
MNTLLAFISTTNMIELNHDQIMYVIYGAIAVALIALVRQSMKAPR